MPTGPNMSVPRDRRVRCEGGMCIGGNIDGINCFPSASSIGCDGGFLVAEPCGTSGYASVPVRGPANQRDAAGEVAPGTPCQTPSDCAVDQLCVYAVADGCSATGTCQDGVCAECNGSGMFEAWCGCDGQSFLVEPCAPPMIPAGFVPAPVVPGPSGVPGRRGCRLNPGVRCQGPRSCLGMRRRRVPTSDGPRAPMSSRHFFRQLDSLSAATTKVLCCRLPSPSSSHRAGEYVRKAANSNSERGGFARISSVGSMSSRSRLCRSARTRRGPPCRAATPPPPPPTT